MKSVCVIGLGYVGLPLACLCAKKGLNVIGLDKKQSVVDLTNEGKCHTQDNKLQQWLLESKEKLIATTNSDDISEISIYVICVPTPVDANKDPDLTPLISVSETISKYLKKEDLVIVESTIFPGTCEEHILPILEKSGLIGGEDFYLAHCPERVNPGDVFWDTENIPRVVGALTEKGTEKAAEFYQRILGGEIFDVKDIKDKLRPKIIPTEKGYMINTMPLHSIIKMHSIKDAEAVKAMENSVRDVNIAFVNELAKISDVLGLDVVDIIDGMSTKPFGKGPFYPGIGVGGHCIAVDPEWLKAASMKAGFFPKIIQIARDTNNSMPFYSVELLENKIGNLEKKKIALLGVTYKGNIDDPRESPYYEVKKILLDKKAIIEVFDPLFKKENTVESMDEALEKSDYLIIVTDHKYFSDKLTFEKLETHDIKFVLDGRNCIDPLLFVNKKIKYSGIGR